MTQIKMFPPYGREIAFLDIHKVVDKFGPLWWYKAIDNTRGYLIVSSLDQETLDAAFEKAGIGGSCDSKTLLE